MSTRQLLAAALTVLAALAPAATEEPGFAARSRYVRERVPAKEIIVCPLLARAPILDGTLDDPLWQQAAAHTESAFTQLGRVEVVSRQTMVYLCRDAAKLYVAFDCEEPEIEQQDVDNKEIYAGDHIGLLVEQGDIRGRGQRFGVRANRAGASPSGGWHPEQMSCVCKAGPKRWMVQIAIPFAAMPLPRPPLRGEQWGLKLVRYGKGAGAGRMRSSWPAIPVISEDAVLHNGRLFFEADDMLLNGSLVPAGGALPGWTVASGAPVLSGATLACAEPVVLSQSVHLRNGEHASLDWTRGGWTGSVRALAGTQAIAAADLSAEHLDLLVPKDGAGEVTIELTLRGAGPAAFRLSSLLDDVPADWICLTGNDWVRGRNRVVRLPSSKPGAYTYLRSGNSAVGFAPYRSVGCPEPGDAPIGDWAWSMVGHPTKPPLDAPPQRPDVGEDELECFPMEVIYSDQSVADRVGLPLGSWDVGGTSGWIPFDQGSLTGDPTWAGWPTDRWANAVPHDLLFSFDQEYFIRRVDILQIKPSFRSLDIAVRGGDDGADPFALVYRRNGPGTDQGYPWSPMPVYTSIPGIDSMGKQLRLSLGITRPDNLQSTGAASDLFGLAEVWIWAEPRGAHKADDVAYFKPAALPEAPPRTCQQLKRLGEPVIWPRPKHLERRQGRFDIDASTVIAAAPGGRIPVLAAQVRDEISRRLLVDPEIVPTKSVAARRAIRIGVAGIDTDFDAECARGGTQAPAEEQGYALTIAEGGVLLVGRGIEGLHNGVAALTQLLEHDERVGYVRCARVVDWPRLTHRTALPSTDHRLPILPFKNSAATYHGIVDALARLRFNALEDYDPTDTSLAIDSATLVRYAGERGIELRPILAASSKAWPGDCIEADPDAQSDGIAHLGGSDGTWETGNLCPSNPRTYQIITTFLDRILTTRPEARYVDLGLLGSRGGPWNVCPRCRARALSDGQLYADFVNRIAQACTQRGLAPVITNAIMLDDPRRRPAFDLLNRAAVLRIDQHMERPIIAVGGFWGLSRPYDAPTALGGGGTYSGGEKFYGPLPPDGAAEGMMQIGEAASWWFWLTPLGRQAITAAEEFWNGPVPVRGKDSAEICDRIEMEAANACVRLHEAIDRGCEYPSWRLGIHPRFYTIDVRAKCTRSHIDEGSVSGIGHSGPREGAVAMGASHDMRRLPLGRQELASVPFEIIDPAANAWRSMILVADAPKGALFPGSVRRVEIPVGRTAASLCVLRTSMRTSPIMGDSSQYRRLIWPAYSMLYEDGTRHVCDREFVRDYDWIESQTFFYGGGLSGSGNIGPGGSSPSLLWTTRCAHMTSSLVGNPVDLYLSEFVNPYPGKSVRALVVELPNPEQRDLVKGYHEAIFAVTGVEPTPWDERYWKRRPPEPLLPPEQAMPAGAAAIDPHACRMADSPNGNILVLPAESACVAAEFRLGMPANYEARTVITRFGHRDCTVSVSVDGQTWSDVGRVTGCTGMDGSHRIVFPTTKATMVRVTADAAAYPDEDPTDVVLLAISAFAAP